MHLGLQALDGALDGSAALRGLLSGMDMPQRRFARLAGLSVSAVSRWCSRHAADRIVPPRSMLALAAALAALPAADREALAAALDRLEAADADDPKAAPAAAPGFAS